MPSITLELPYRLSGAKLRSVVQKFIDGCKERLPKQVKIDFSRLGFIEPAGITFLSNFIRWLHHRGVSVFFQGYRTQSEALRFLDDSLFFKEHLGENINARAHPRSTTRPLVHIHHEQSHDWLRVELVPWLACALTVTNASLRPLQVCVSEIFNNIQDHSTLEIGSIFAQHFPKLNRVSIAVADFGRGIPSTARDVYPDLRDNEAILKSVESGFTTKSNRRNRGDGLAYLLQTVVATNGGTVTIFSLSGSVTFYRRGTEICNREWPNVGFCPGTTIDISLRTDNIEYLDEEPEELEW